MKFYFTLFFSILLVIGSFTSETFAQNPYGLPAYFKTIHLDVNTTTQEAVFEYLQDNLTSMKAFSFELKLVKESESPFGYHFTYQLHANGYPVKDKLVLVNLDKENSIRSLFDNTELDKNWNRADLSFVLSDQEAANLVDKYVRENYSDAAYSFEKIYLEAEKLFPAYSINLVNPGNHQRLDIVIDENGEQKIERNLSSYSSPIDTSITVWVFNPDPLTSSGNSYGCPYCDNNDSTNNELDAASVKKTVIATWSSGVFSLINQYVEIASFSAPSDPVVTSTTPEFKYNRLEQGFEDVNAFYHITTFAEYVVGIGFGAMIANKVYADVHALDGDDQSQFTPGPPSQLFFGEGGVDDAEDADVLVHEYGHALSNWANGTNSKVSKQRTALDEGLGDYFAVSYGRSINEFCWEAMFTWDGHNEFWDGRTAASTKHYPEDLVANEHIDAELWSSALMELWSLIGRETLDTLVLESLYSWPIVMSMQDAAELMIATDSFITGGKNFLALYKVFFLRGFIDRTPSGCIFVDKMIDSVKAGNNQIICREYDSSIVLGATPIPNLGAFFSWAPGVGLESPYSQTTKAFVSKSTTFTLTVIDTINLCAKEETVVITVDTCFNNQIKVVNTIEFLHRSGKLYIYLPDNTADATLKLFDVSGRLLWSEEYDMKNVKAVSSCHDVSWDNTEKWKIIEYQNTALHPGIYFLMVETPTRKLTTKLIKIVNTQ